jgi:hypothetical protein
MFLHIGLFTEYQRITPLQIKRKIGWEIQHLMYLLCGVTNTCTTSVTNLTLCGFIQYKVHVAEALVCCVYLTKIVGVNVC